MANINIEDAKKHEEIVADIDNWINEPLLSSTFTRNVTSDYIVVQHVHVSAGMESHVQ